MHPVDKQPSHRKSGPNLPPGSGSALLLGFFCVLLLAMVAFHWSPAVWGKTPQESEKSSDSSLSSAITVSSTPSPKATPTPSPEPDPTSSPQSEVVEEQPWNLRLVNKTHLLPETFQVELTSVEGGQFDSRAASSLEAMLQAMEEQGLSPVICSSFRTWEDQDTLHQEKLQSCLEEGYSPEEAETEASRWVVPPGASEHQLGLAVDIVASDYQILEETQENTPEQQWLMAHCWEYGFILRYPQDKVEITGVGYEPWHYRYVGTQAAREIMESQVCLEEYLGET